MILHACPVLNAVSCPLPEVLPFPSVLRSALPQVAGLILTVCVRHYRSQSAPA